MTSIPAGILQRVTGSFRRAWQTHPDLMATALLLLVAIPSRLVFLGADPPMDLQMSWFWDEGGWAHNAQVHELLGVWTADDHNAPLVLAPLYTMVLTAFYRVFGLGLIQTRLVSAASGILTILALYGAIRAVRAPSRALGAALAFTLSYFVITHQRVAYTEAHQLLWAVVGFAGVLWARRSPRWALLGGIGIALAQLVKPSAFLLFPAVLGYWMWQESPEATDSPARGFPRVEVAWFSAGVALVAVPVAAILLANWSFVWGYVAISLRSTMALTYTPHVDLIVGLFRLPATGFAQQSMIQVAAVGVLAWYRLVRPSAGHPDAVERFAWVWLGLGLLSLGLIRYQPDRRFLLLSAPLAILFATAMGSRLAPPASGQVPLVGTTRRVSGGAILGFALGWAAIALGIRLGIGVPPRNWSRLWSMAVLGGGLVSMLMPLRLNRVVAMTPLTLLIPIFLLLEPLRFSLYLPQSRPTFLDAARRLAAISRDLPLEARVMVGPGGSTLSLESRIIYIGLRINPSTGANLNHDAWERFHPGLALVGIPPGKPQSDGGEAKKRGFRLCTNFEVLPNKNGVWYRRMELWIRPDLISHCEALPNPTGDALDSETSDPGGKGSR